MKARTLVAVAILAAGVPLGAALANGNATTLGGPQGNDDAGIG